MAPTTTLSCYPLSLKSRFCIVRYQTYSSKALLSKIYHQRLYFKLGVVLRVLKVAEGLLALISCPN